MENSETYFGLLNISGEISADGGETFLPKYADMSTKFFEDLVFDIEYYIEKELTPIEINDLKEILS